MTQIACPALTEGRFSNLGISVEQDGERVVLKGRVGSYYLKQLAQEVVKRSLNGTLTKIVLDNRIEVS